MRLLATISLIILASQLYAQEPGLNETFAFRENGAIKYNEKNLRSWRDPGIGPGDKTVFYFQSDNNGDPGNNSKCNTYVAFEVEPDVDNFRLKDAAIEEHNGMYIQNCLAADRGCNRISNGTISGKKLPSGNWEVDVNVWVKGAMSGKTYRFAFKRTYLKAQ